jgi:hypothetical protein
MSEIVGTTKSEPEKCFLHRFIGHYDMNTYYEIHPGMPIVEGFYDGSKDHFESEMFNLSSTQQLREYGLLHQLPFILKSLVLAFDDEHLKEVAEVNIAHYNHKLIRMRNSEGNKEKLEVLHFDLGDFFEFLKKENYSSKFLNTSTLAKKYGIDTDSISSKLKHLGVVVLAIGISIVAYQAFSHYK